MQHEDIQYRLLRLLQDNPQRNLAAELGVSIGSARKARRTRTCED